MKKREEMTGLRLIEDVAQNMVESLPARDPHQLIAELVGMRRATIFLCGECPTVDILSECIAKCISEM